MRISNLKMQEITFSPSKALESLLYLASKLQDPDIHTLLKLRYFADKAHLSRYGFLASGDKYFAMQFGPVASNTYNIIRAARGEKNDWIHPAFIEAVNGNLEISKDNHKVKALRKPNTELLSKADMECLDEAISEFGSMSFLERTAISHDAAWMIASEAAANDGVDAGHMSVTSIAKTLSNREEILELLQN